MGMSKEILRALLEGVGTAGTMAGETLQRKAISKDDLMNELAKMEVKRMMEQSDPKNKAYIDYLKAQTEHLKRGKIGDQYKRALRDKERARIEESSKKVEQGKDILSKGEDIYKQQYGTTEGFMPQARPTAQEMITPRQNTLDFLNTISDSAGMPFPLETVTRPARDWVRETFGKQETFAEPGAAEPIQYRQAPTVSQEDMQRYQMGQEYGPEVAAYQLAHTGITTNEMQLKAMEAKLIAEAKAGISNDQDILKWLMGTLARTEDGKGMDPEELTMAAIRQLPKIKDALKGVGMSQDPETIIAQLQADNPGESRENIIAYARSKGYIE